MVVHSVQYIKRGLLFICYRVFGDTSNKIGVQHRAFSL
jgi:hypothetical protein